MSYIAIHKWTCKHVCHIHVCIVICANMYVTYCDTQMDMQTCMSYIAIHKWTCKHACHIHVCIAICANMYVIYCDTQMDRQTCMSHIVMHKWICKHVCHIHVCTAIFANIRTDVHTHHPRTFLGDTMEVKPSICGNLSLVAAMSTSRSRHSAVDSIILHRIVLHRIVLSADNLLSICVEYNHSF